jgi:hypothetical protein
VHARVSLLALQACGQPDSMSMHATEPRDFGAEPRATQGCTPAEDSPTQRPVCITDQGSRVSRDATLYVALRRGLAVGPPFASSAARRGLDEGVARLVLPFVALRFERIGEGSRVEAPRVVRPSLCRTIDPAAMVTALNGLSKS